MSVSDNVSIKELKAGVFELMIISPIENPVVFDLDYFKRCVQISLDILREAECYALIIRLQGPHTPMPIKDLFETSQFNESFKEELHEINALILEFKEVKKPILGITDDICLSQAFSFLLLCDYRFAVADKVKLGFPEGEFGLFPGLGSTLMLQRILGSQKAFNLFVQGKVISSEKALDLGILDQHFSNHHQATQAAEKILLSQKKDKVISQADIDLESHREEELQTIEKKINPAYPGIGFYYLIFKHSNSKTLKEILNMEHMAMIYVLESTTVKAVVRSLYYGVKQAKSLGSSSEQKPYETNKIAIIGAGMMGSGIAYVAAKAGIEVVLKDVKLKTAEYGKTIVHKLASKAVASEQMKEEQKEQLLSKITPSDQIGPQATYDLIIEAVFEDKELKAKVIDQTIPFLKLEGFYASNTTSLPIAELSKKTPDPSRFIGLHFFSPVDRMPLVEIIVGQQTSSQTLSKALQFVHKLAKVPIVVNDGPAFFTSRIFFNYLLEGISMVLQGIPTELTEQAAKNAGFAVGPLAVLDEISLELMAHVYKQLPKLTAAQIRASQYLEKLIQQGRKGRKSGKGFYDYSAQQEKVYWKDPDIPTLKHLPARENLEKRLLNVVSLDSYRCLEEGILIRPIDGDIGSILGIGFPRFTGGVFSYMDQVGLSQFVLDCQQCDDLGEQWEIPNSLRELAKSNFSFFTDFKTNWAE